jgi:hypothetical protein
MTVRGPLAVVLALLLAAQVVRNAAVDALSAKSPDTASRIWRGHPDAELSLGMTQIGRAAHEKRSADAPVFASIDDAAIKAPLAPEPFLVHGVQAQLAGQTRVAEQNFLAAELRDPRSLPARYFLADIFYRAGDRARTLQQIATLARLTPNGPDTLGPYLAAYAADRSSWPYLRKLFQSDANLEASSLVALAGNAANADAVLAISDPRRRSTKSAWLPVLLESLDKAGEYQQARTIWADISGIPHPPDATLYDWRFADSRTPPPFNWRLVSSTVGLAERQPGGRLHVIFYGQEDGVLASQLLVLPAGSYQIAMSVSGDPARTRALKWSIRCDKSDKPLAEIGLDQFARGAWTFSVPPQCGAQWLELSGSTSDIAQQSDVTVSGLRLAAEKPNG